MMKDWQVDVADVVRLMRDYLEQRIDAAVYRTRLFEFFTVRMEPHDKETGRILQQAYGDADDFDATIRLPFTIEEPELRARVEGSLAQLRLLGHEPLT